MPEDEGKQPPDTRTDAERFEDGIKHLFTVPKKDVMDSLEADKRERKKKRESGKK